MTNKGGVTWIDKSGWCVAMARTMAYDSEDEQFTYDNLGNRLTTVNRDSTTDYYTPDSTNEYDQVIVNSVTKMPAYDANGTKTDRFYAARSFSKRRITDFS